MNSLIHQFRSIWKHDAETRFEPVGDLRAGPDSFQRQQEKLLARIRRIRLQNTALHQRIEKRGTRLQVQITELAELAKAAVKSGRDDVARLALQQGQLATIQLRLLQAHLREVHLEKQRVALIEQRLAAHIQALQIRGEMARFSPKESLGDYRSEWTDLGASVEQAEENTESMQAHAYALEHLAEFEAIDLATGTVGQVFTGQTKPVEIRAEVERQLENLKSSNGLITRSAEPAAGLRPET